MSLDYCSYCGKEDELDNLINMEFYMIGDLACTECAINRIDEIQNEIIPSLRARIAGVEDTY